MLYTTRWNSGNANITGEIHFYFCNFYLCVLFLYVCFCQCVTSMQRRGDGISLCFSCVVSTSRIPRGLFCLMAKASLCSRWYLFRLFPKNATSASDTHTQHKKCVTIMILTIRNWLLIMMMMMMYHGLALWEPPGPGLHSLCKTVWTAQMYEHTH